MKRVLVTGANGYIGQALGSALCWAGYVPVAAIREAAAQLNPDYAENHIVGDIGASTDWRLTKLDIDCVIHLAARTHVLNETSKNPLNEFRRVNRDATLTLARQAVQAGVKRFIYVSSIGVLGGKTDGKVFDNQSAFNPIEPYAVSKMEAELGLHRLVINTEMELVIVRPPLVYGPGAPGNFSRLLKLVAKFRVLPLGAFSGKKSMISLKNFLEVLVVCVSSKVAAGKSFVVSDGVDLSVTDLVKMIASQMNRKVFVISIPTLILTWVSFFGGRRRDLKKLANSLRIDCTETCALLNWTPTQKPIDAIAETINELVQKEITKRQPRL